MLTINFKLDDGYYFYPSTDAKLNAAFPNAFVVREEITTADKIARWTVPSTEYVKFNMYLLLEHPSLSQLLEKKVKLINTFKATNSNEAKNALENFMKNVMGILKEILKTCHELYWLDTTNKIRSQYSFEECLQRGIDFGYEKLKIMNIITEINQPIGIASTIIESQVDEKVRSSKKKMGYAESSTMGKKSKKK